MASWDYPSVAAPTTANYAAPLVDFSKIANLPKDYYAGKEMARQDEKATAFRNGIPRVDNDPNGPIDVNAVTDKLARINPDYAMPLINMQLQGQQGQTAANAIMGGQGGPGPTAQPTAQPGTPAAAPQRVAAPAASPASLSPAAPGDNSQDTIRSLATEWSGGQDAMGAIGSAARTLRINPDAPLTPEDTARVKSFLSNAARGPVVAQNDSQPAGQAAASPVQPQAAQPQSDERPGWGQADADSLSLRATRLNAYAAAVANVNPKAAEAAKAEAVATEGRAKQIRDYISGEDSSTPDQKNYQSDKLPGESMADYQARAAAGSELSKQDSIAYSKKYEGIQKAAQEASIEQPKIQLMKTFSNDPNFYSGPLEPTNRGFKQFAATIGADPNKALPQEGFNKVASDMLTSQIRALGASGAGPVRIAEVKNMQKSIANLGITPVTNRLLVEITDRAYNDVKAIADLTRQYELNPKNLPGKKNVGLDAAIQRYYDSHPLFSKEEVSDPRLIAPPEFKDSRAAFNAKLPKGQPVKIDGKLKWVQ